MDVPQKHTVFPLYVFLTLALLGSGGLFLLLYWALEPSGGFDSRYKAIFGAPALCLFCYFASTRLGASKTARGVVLLTVVLSTLYLLLELVNPH